MVQAIVEDIPAGRFTDATIRRMYQLVDGAKTDEKFQKLVSGVVNRSMRGQWKQYRREAQTLLNWVKQNVDYRRDPVNVELLQDPWRTLDVAKGDCDDMSILIGSALETLGTPIRFVTVSTKPDGEPSHVYIEAHLDGRWTAIDPIVKASFVGWAPSQGITSRRAWSRPDVGLAGGEETPVDGYGMNGHCCPPGPCRCSSRRALSGIGSGWTDSGILARRGLAPLRRDEFGHTRANPWPGEAFRSGRLESKSPVARYADTPGLPLPGGFTRYSVRRQIESNPTPAQLARFIPYNSPAFDLPSMTGAIPTWKEYPNAMLPHPYSDSDPVAHDLSGLGASLARSIIGDQRRLQRAIQNEAHRKMVAAARELNRQVVAEKHRLRLQQIQERQASIARSPNVNRRRLLRIGQPAGIHPLSGLGADAVPAVAPTATQVTQVSTAVSSAVQSGEVPKSPTLISQAIDLAVGLWASKQAADAAKKLAAQQAAITTQAATVAPAASAPSSRSPWLVPAGIAAALVVAGGLLK